MRLDVPSGATPMTAQSKPDTETPKVSETPRTLLQRLNAVMQDVSYVQKDHTIEVGKGYKVVTHDAVTAKVRPALVNHGVFYYPYELTRHQSGNRTEADMKIRFVNIDDKADFIDVPTFGYGIDQGDKGPGKAMSYAVKMALLKALGLETGEDADNEVTQYQKADPVGHEYAGKQSAKGPRGGKDKTPAAESEIKLFLPTDTYSYPRKIEGVARFIDDLEIAVAGDMTVWDTNSNSIELARHGAQANKRGDLLDRLADIEATITVETMAAG